MPEEDKVGHILKGIAEDVYNFLIGKESLTSMSEVVKHIWNAKNAADSAKMWPPL